MDRPATTPIHRADPHEAASISELAVRSKAHWGYDAAVMAIFREELTITPAEIRENETWVIGETEPMAFYSLETAEGGGIALGHLFVDPVYLRRRLGRRLLAHALGRAKARGAVHLQIVADPQAEGFYLALGAQRVGEVESSIAGRHLPLLYMNTEAIGAAGEYDEDEAAG